ncbi:GNAT family N-acetyltransferase [Paenibacillus piri]|uniref:GNAT family N-acetyltransferase n=1 Tax=Paenibacillus piri TaxID=2547395 RepID=A0A4V2ZSD2_9BACL|nr:GNAT family N-acetyltransferase [Paenibacillus piri]TDF92764.1 GNAT family N-acetyltransferase [Paenibacillus piri]
MYLLPKHQYEKVRSLFEPFTHQLITKSVLVGNTVGAIYVDQVEEPKSAVMNGIVFEMLFAGDPGNEYFNRKFGEMLERETILAMKGSGMPYLNLYYESEAWKQAIMLEIAKRQKLSPLKKRFYTMNSASYVAPIKPLNRNASLRLLDGSLLRDPTLDNLDQVMPWINLAWPSVERFLEHGIGYCIVEKNTIASWCLSLFADSKHHEFGLITDEAYRGKGYAKTAASACVRHCLDDGMIPYWNCDDHNTGSVLVAESIGFKKEREYSVFQIFVDSENV